ncbi:MAG TPA: beta-propeller fold lactonase family protein [Ktedonobacterales bacterium]|nr:beta-propeller fold lactonase family protein [Ktedonobacterales bacterium]
MRFTSASRLVTRLVAPALGALTALSLLGFTTQAHAASQLAGHVYVLDNPAGQNSITVYNRFADGTLQYVADTAIGGLGTGNPLGSQGSLTLAGDRLFAVDGGSDQISVINAHDGALTLDGVYSSYGALPVSVTYRDGFLYVVNSGSASQAANVVGFRVGEHGALAPITGADVALSAAQPGPAQVALSPDGSTLAVTEKATNLVDTFRVAENGSLGDRVSVASSGETPFGFSFNPAQPRELVVADAYGGAIDASAVSSYRVGAAGAVSNGAPVADYQTAACWLVITANGKFAYTANAGSGTISGYRLSNSGGLSLLDASGLTASTGAASHPLEMTFSPDNAYLYVLDAGTHTLSGFAVAHNGALSPITLAGVSLQAGAVGLAAD